MFLSQLAADMVLHLSDGATEDCAARMAGEYEKDGVYERSSLTYLLLSSLMMDYLIIMKLKKGNNLHEALVIGWGKLVRVFSRGSFSYPELCQYCDSELIPIQFKHLLHDVPKDYDGNGILELPKSRVDNLISVMTFVKEHIFMAINGDDAGKWFMEAGKLLLTVGESMPPGTKLSDDSFIFPHSGSRQNKAEHRGSNDEDRLFNLD
jgi:hypothetical protein